MRWEASRRETTLYRGQPCPRGGLEREEQLTKVRWEAPLLLTTIIDNILAVTALRGVIQ